ncbi:hypothetical protein ACCO45_006775 [Purpureocillium lilacinum]|uniref:Uncharacterized protein n=1 Tax=Purpureocillium lilacinum TaxID=33203 RepID=A0ACC4DTI7_PURLI
MAENGTNIPSPTAAAPRQVVAKTAGGNSAYHNFHNDFTHIADLNERRRLALAEVDKAPFGWYHVRACVVAGVGFFTDSYDIFTASLLTIMLGIVYYPGVGKMPTSSDNAIKLATSAGTVVGQLGFGFLADLVGRKRMYGLELIVIIFATIGQALTSGSPSCDIIGLIIFWRVIMGVGIGGDYPLSSIITSEAWASCALPSSCSSSPLGFKGSLEGAASVKSCTGDCQVAVDKMWRTLIGFGAVPACIALYFRLTIPETPRYTFDVARDVEKAQDDVKAYMSGKREGDPDAMAQVATSRAAKDNLEVPKASWADFRRHYGKPKNFCSSSALRARGSASTSPSTACRSTTFLYNTAIGNLIIVLAGAVPGYWVSVATIDTLGRKKIQLGGFIILTILFIVMGFAYHNISKNGLLAIYVLAQFFFNFGPNTTTFIVPGEVFPTRYRSTSHGISAASGKIGSIIGQGAISTLRTHGAIYALFMLLGCFTTLLIPETARKTLEELSGEDDFAVTGRLGSVSAHDRANSNEDEPVKAA